MELINAEFCMIRGDINMDILYSIFNNHTGIQTELEIGQEYGTDCFGMVRFHESVYPTLEKLEKEIEEIKQSRITGIGYRSYYPSLVVNYLRRKGVLPEKDFLFEVSY